VVQGRRRQHPLRDGAMKAFVARAFGGPEVATLDEVAEPTLGANDVMVDVRAAALNPVDAKVRDGGLKPILSTRPPFILGCDVAGVVSAKGAAVTRFAVGDEVFGRLEKSRMGALAERVAAHESVLAKKPKSIGFAEAASLPLVALTALQCLREAGGVVAGKRVLITAGAGGLGSAAIQIAKILGASVVTTTSTKNIDLVRSLGADEIIDYTKDSLDARGKVDVVLDSLGPESELAMFRLLQPGGIVVGVASPPDLPFARASLPVFARPVIWFLDRKRRATAKALGVRFAWVFMRPDGAQVEEIARYVDEGTLKPVVHKRFAFADVKDAFAELATGHARGKIVVDVAAG
jgi:NADPH:quinone reductase-like Zn-dependent oxidoreductase